MCCWFTEFCLIIKKSTRPARSQIRHAETANVVIIEEITFLVIESLTYGITCRPVQEILLVSTS